VVDGIFGMAIAHCDKDENGNIQHNPLVAIGVETVFERLTRILEPSLNNPHYQQFCHSPVVLGLLGNLSNLLLDLRTTSSLLLFKKL